MNAIEIPISANQTPSARTNMAAMIATALMVSKKMVLYAKVCLSLNNRIKTGFKVQGS